MKGNRNSSVGAQEVRRTVSRPEFDSFQGREADHLSDSNTEFENDRSCTFALAVCCCVVHWNSVACTVMDTSQDVW